MRHCRAPIIIFSLLASVGVAALLPEVARAAACGSLYADSGDNDIILGEETSYFWYEGQKYYYGLGELAVCWKQSGGSWTLASPGCDSSSSSSDYIYVAGYAGNDRVAPNLAFHVCTTGNYINPWDGSVFDFYLYASMGTGVDRAYGTDHGDTLYSNVPGTVPAPTPADSAEDFLCGYEGNDTMYGDKDDSDTYEEVLHGGVGSGDYCNGGWDGNTYDWGHTSCETSVYAYSTGTDYGSCGSAPVNIWWDA